MTRWDLTVTLQDLTVPVRDLPSQVPGKVSIKSLTGPSMSELVSVKSLKDPRRVPVRLRASPGWVSVKFRVGPEQVPVKS